MVLKAAVVGCGRIGCGFDDDPLRKMVSTHAGAYNKHPKTKLYALCDIDKSKLKKYGKKFSVENLFTNVDELLKNTNLDLVSVCTTPDQHEEVVVKAALSGVKGIFCEKPIADTLSAAKHMIDVCEEKKTILIIDHQRRFDPFYSTIKRWIEKGKIGKVNSCTSYYTAGIFNTGTHLLDLMCYFFGDIEWVVGQYSRTKSPNPNDPNIDGFIKFKNGVLSSIHALDVKHYLIFEQDILGTKGRFRILDSGFNLEFYNVAKSKYYKGYHELKKTSLPFKLPKVREPWIEGVDHLVNCVSNKLKPVSSGYDGFKSLESILALIKSAENNVQKIYLPLKIESSTELKQI